MGKTALEAQRLNAFLLEPERLKLVTDQAHPLFDARVLWEPEESLIRNIMAHGVKVALLVRKDGDDILVVDGRQRTKAALEANRRLVKEGKEPVKVKVMLERGDDADLFGTMVLTNALRRGNTPMMTARDVFRYVGMGRTVPEAAVTFGLTQQQVNGYLALLEMSPKAQKRVEAGTLSVNAAVALAKLSRADQEKALEELDADGVGPRGKTATVKRVAAKVRAKKGKAPIYAPPTRKELATAQVRWAALAAKHQSKMMAGAALALSWAITGAMPTDLLELEKGFES
jgi:ParB family transcriptional regulator, chromosome partitioning protein